MNIDFKNNYVEHKYLSSIFETLVIQMKLSMEEVLLSIKRILKEIEKSEATELRIL